MAAAPADQHAACSQLSGGRRSGAGGLEPADQGGWNGVLQWCRKSGASDPRGDSDDGVNAAPEAVPLEKELGLGWPPVYILLDRDDLPARVTRPCQLGP